MVVTESSTSNVRATSTAVSRESVWSGVRLHIGAIGLYLLLTILVTWPMAQHFTTQVIAEQFFDRAQNIWNLWWVKEALVDQHTSPFYTNMVLYPQGIDLYFHALGLPSTLLTLVPLLLFGLAGAYNAGILFALVLSGYAGFRLVYYLTRNPAAALLGGMIIGFNPLSQAMIRSQINIASIQWFVLCIEFFLRTWSHGRRRDGVLTGIFFTLALLNVGYFEVHLGFFAVAFLAWALLTSGGASLRERVKRVLVQGRTLFVWGGGTVLVLAGPYLLAAYNSLRKDQLVVWAPNDNPRLISNSADLLSFFVPNRAHWLLGEGMPWWQGINHNIHDYAYLGVVTVALAAIGVWSARKRSMTWLWVALAVLGVILGLGPVLQVNGSHTFGTTEVPLPFGLLRNLPVLSLVRSPERFVTLTFVAMGVLSGYAIRALLSAPAFSWRKVAVAGAFVLLVLEWPIHYRPMSSLEIPSSFTALGNDQAPGALLELPLIQHTKIEAHRMLYQTVHGRPITSAYLSRDVVDPYVSGCSRLKPIKEYPTTPTEDIISPTASPEMFPQLLAEDGFGFIAVYKQATLESERLTPIDPDYVRTLQELAASLGTPIAEDEIATIYRLRPATQQAGTFLQLGPPWHDLQESYGQPFRWMDGAVSDFCVFRPSPATAALSFQVTSFASPRTLQVWVGDRKVHEVVVPADLALHPVTTPPISWPAGAQGVRFVSVEGSTSPASLGQSSDTRQLSLGFSMIRLTQGDGEGTIFSRDATAAR